MKDWLPEIVDLARFAQEQHGAESWDALSAEQKKQRLLRALDFAMANLSLRCREEISK